MLGAANTSLGGLWANQQYVKDTITFGDVTINDLPVITNRSATLGIGPYGGEVVVTDALLSPNLLDVLYEQGFTPLKAYSLHLSDLGLSSLNYSLMEDTDAFQKRLQWDPSFLAAMMQKNSWAILLCCPC